MTITSTSLAAVFVLVVGTACDGPDASDLETTTAAAASSCGRLATNESLNRGESVSACNGAAELVHQHDGNVVLYRKNPHAPLWSTATAGRATTSFVMQGDSNLVLYGSTGAMWSSGTHYGPAGASLRVQDDCNLVIYSAAGTAYWSSHTHGCTNQGSWTKVSDRSGGCHSPGSSYPSACGNLSSACTRGARCYVGKDSCKTSANTGYKKLQLYRCG
jgi:hypothetical protein